MGILRFEDKYVRKTEHNGDIYFSVEDLVAISTNSINPKDYIKKMRSRDSELSKGWGQIVTPLALLNRENLRDNMTDMELALVNIGELTAKELHRSRDTKGRRNLECYKFFHITLTHPIRRTGTRFNGRIISY
jgi:hypothetical protein